MYEIANQKLNSYNLPINGGQFAGISSVVPARSSFPNVISYRTCPNEYTSCWCKSWAIKNEWTSTGQRYIWISWYNQTPWFVSVQANNDDISKALRVYCSQCPITFRQKNTLNSWGKNCKFTVITQWKGFHPSNNISFIFYLTTLPSIIRLPVCSCPKDRAQSFS